MTPSVKIPVAIVLGGLIIAGALFLSMGGSFSGDVRKRGDPALVRPVDSSDHILGNPNAPVMIVEYADFDCTFCADLSGTLRRIVATSGARGEVAWVFRQFPLTELHPNAHAHARASECVAKTAGNEAFWRFADLLFANQPVEPARYGALASQAGVTDTDAFATCYADAANQVDARIQADRENALDSGASGTPYSLILVAGAKPIVIDGTYPYDIVKRLVDEALAKLP
jgi:protein-disulfide isomerase